MNSKNLSVLAIVGLLLLIPVFSAAQGFLLMLLWGWFIVPLGVVSLTLPQAMGISILIRMYQTAVTDKNYEKLIVENIVYLVVTFVFAYILHFFV